MTRSGVNRRRFLQLVGTATGGALAGCGRNGTSDAPSDTETESETPHTATGTTQDTDGVRAETFAEGFTSPVDIEILDGLDRRVVVDQPGRVYLHDSTLRETPLLDVRDRVVDVRGGYDERGLLGLAFHPHFDENGRLFVRYSAPRRSGTPSDYDHTFVLSEFQTDPNARRVDPATERVLLELPQPQANHNAGSIAFGPDGFLYVGVGDGGRANDAGRGHVDDWYDRNQGGNGQDVTENLLGSILRLDVDEEGTDRPYAIPDDNPLVGRDGLDEQFAWGFRNPWRFSFDGSDLYVADVGQSRYEEVSLVESGGNYGWNVREGTHCFSTDSPQSPPNDCPHQTSDGAPLHDPIIEYPHSGDETPSGRAVIGGYRYHRSTLSPLSGTYVFADWGARGHVFAATPVDEGLWPIDVVPVEGLGPYVLAFGRDADGHLYVLTTAQTGVTGATGKAHRLRPK